MIKIWINFLAFIVVIVKPRYLFSNISKSEKGVLLGCPILSNSACVFLFKPISDLVVQRTKVKFSENRLNIGGRLYHHS